jgi:MFS family permease
MDQETPEPANETTITDGPTSPRARAFAIALLLAGAVCAGMGQTIVFSVLPPLAREIGLSDLQVGLIFMISATGWVTFGPRWGLASDKTERKPFILIGLIGLAVSSLLFGASIRMGVVGALSGAPLYALMVVTRSLYGVFGSAGPPAAQAYIADRTSQKDRTAGIASFSAAFGLGAMLGPGFGAAAAVFGPVAPFFAMAGLAAIMSAAVFAFLPERTKPVRRAKHAKLKLSDKRLRPLLIYGLVFGVTNAIPLQTIGFYFIDRLGFSTELAPQLVGLGLMGGAMASLFSQLVIVQRYGLAPRTLMRIAPVLMIVGHLLIWTTAHLGMVVFGMVIAGFGAGLANPGYNAAASLAVRADEQGAAIGLANAAGASGFIVSPLIGFGLYAVAPQAPYIFTMTLAMFLWGFALKSRVINNAQPDIVSETLGEPPASAPYQ